MFLQKGAAGVGAGLPLKRRLVSSVEWNKVKKNAADSCLSRPEWNCRGSRQAAESSLQEIINQPASAQILLHHRPPRPHRGRHPPPRRGRRAPLPSDVSFTFHRPVTKLKFS